MMHFQNGWPIPGSVVSVPTHLIYRHMGIVSDVVGDDGKPMVISNSLGAGGIAEEPWDIFSSGHEVRNDGYLGALSPLQVLYRARFSQRRKYDALAWNCENFVNYCHGVPVTSSQVVTTLLVVLAGTALLTAKA